MIERLEQLTMAQFIDLACGDMSVLHPYREIVTPAKVATAAKNIIYEYRTIVDEAGVKSFISSIEETTKANMEVVIFKICTNMIAIGEFERVREILNEYGVNADSMSHRRLTAEVKSRLGRAKRRMECAERADKENENKETDKTELRTSFDVQTAALMAHFKFQIDISTMKATLYAHLVSRFNREVKAQLAAMKKK
jgi:hypothetical protein